MASAKYNIKIECGADWERIFTIKNATTLVPVDLTGCTVRMHVRQEAESTETLDILTTENGRIALVNRDNPLGGVVLGGIKVMFPNAVTTAYTWTEPAVYQLELVYASGIVERRLHGSVTLSSEVTR
jgi:hypothetical protein